MSLVNTLRHYRTFEAVATDGISIAYEDPGRGEPLVLLHGVTENSEILARDRLRRSGSWDVGAD